MATGQVIQTPSFVGQVRSVVQRLSGQIVQTPILVGHVNTSSGRLQGSVTVIPSASNNVIQLQQAEYDALPEKAMNVYYFITG